MVANVISPAVIYVVQTGPTSEQEAAWENWCPKPRKYLNCKQHYVIQQPYD